MAIDGFKPRGVTKSTLPTAGGGIIRSTPMLGIVKDNIDSTRSGRIQVYLKDLGGKNPDNSSSWITVNYLSPFFGATTPRAGDTGWGDFVKNPNSYGMWNSPPDIGTVVVCLFINGDPNYGFYIGAIPPADSLHMVPAIGGSDNIVANAGEAKSLGGAARLPVVNVNSNNQGIANSSKYLTDAKPVHSYAASVLAQQGLIRDPIRGVIGTTAQRESPSRVGWGVSTPGRPIYEGGHTDETIAQVATGDKPTGLNVIARRGGHTLVMDDGDILGRDQLVRIRTSLGHQILMSDDGQCLHIIHANGQSWVELGKEGTIDMYATNSVNVRTQGDLNLHADNNININAGKNLNIAAGENIEVNAEKDMKFRVGANFNQYVIEKYTVKIDGRMSMASGGDASYASEAITYINGSKINLNTGSASLVPQKIDPMTVTAHTDTLYDATKGWAAAPGKLLSIVSRAPAHAPWASANQGVDVKVNNNASAALPATPSPAVAATNASANQSGLATPISQAVTSTVPSMGAISPSLPQTSTSTLLAASSTMAATGEAADAVKLGAGIVETAEGKVGSIGIMAQTPTQLDGKVLKPGAGALVNKLLQEGKTLEEAMTPNLFTGKAGAENLNSYVNNVSAQIEVQTANAQIAEKSLKASGALPDNLSPVASSGMVLSTMTAGLAPTLAFMKNAASSTLGAVTGVVGDATKVVNNLLGGPAKLIATGNLAGAISDKVTGGLSSVSSALDGMKKSALGSITGLIDSAKGVAAGAFDAITKSIPTLKVGVPQNIKDITEKALASAQAPAAGSNPLSGVIAGVTGAVDKTIGAATGLIKTTLGATANLSTGLGLLPGGDKSAVSIAGDIVPGVPTVTGLINTSADITNGLSNATSVNPLASSDVLNSAVNIKDGLTNKLDGLKSGKTSLTSLALSGLPSGSAGPLLSLIDSAPGGLIKLATASVGTSDRNEQDAQTASILPDGVPAPSYGGNKATLGETAGTIALSKANQKTAKIADLDEKLAQQKKIADDAIAAEQTAKNSLPAGDPSIAELRQKAMAEVDKQIAIQNEILATLRA